MPRAASETTPEYIHDLKQQWPEAEAELDELTRAFVEARYSPQPIDKRAVARAKEEWKRVRERLRRSARRPYPVCPNPATKWWIYKNKKPQITQLTQICSE